VYRPLNKHKLFLRTSLTDEYIIIEVECLPRSTTESIYRTDYASVFQYLVDVTNHEERNLIKKEAEKILKYKDLILEIQRMWNVEAKVIQVITGATGTI